MNRKPFLCPECNSFSATRHKSRKCKNCFNTCCFCPEKVIVGKMRYQKYTPFWSIFGPFSVTFLFGKLNWVKLRNFELSLPILKLDCTWVYQSLVLQNFSHFLFTFAFEFHVKSCSFCLQKAQNLIDIGTRFGLHRSDWRQISKCEPSLGNKAYRPIIGHEDPLIFCIIMTSKIDIPEILKNG